MKKILVTAVAAVSALAVTGAAGAALQPGVHDPATTGCVKSTLTKGVLHLEKNCPTTTDAAAGAVITGANGQEFKSASFTLASKEQCQGGSPRFVVVTTTGLFALGCNNVTPTTNANGTATYLINTQTLAAAGQQVPTPTGAITFVSVLIDVQGTADLTKITFNGVKQKLLKAKGGDLSKPCKKGGWKTMENPKFKNQGQCVRAMAHARNAARKSGG